jgi:hypothetical protein
MPRTLSLAVVAAFLLASSCTAEQQICGRMDTLCGTSREECAKLVKDTQASFGEQGVQDLRACFSDAKTCSEAGGCVAAKGLKNMGAAFESFFKGLMKGLEGEKK